MLTDLKANVAAGGDSMLPADGRWMVVGGLGGEGERSPCKSLGESLQGLVKKVIGSVYILRKLD